MGAAGIGCDGSDVLQRTKWEGIAADLREGIRRDGVDYRVPTERELQATYRVARNTVRRALAELSYEGLIKLVAGRGRIVADGAHVPMTRVEMIAWTEVRCARCQHIRGAHAGVGQCLLVEYELCGCDRFEEES